MCTRHRPANGADSEELSPAEALNSYVADSIVRNNPTGWRDWLRAKQCALQAERESYLDVLIAHRLVPAVWISMARELAVDPDAEPRLHTRPRNAPLGGLPFELVDDGHGD